jgi:hypothetical protein
MGTIILIIAFVIEVAFATYCIITRSNQKRVRSFVRIGALAAFVLFMLVSVIQWSFRWYGLAVLLLVWAALADTQAGGGREIWDRTYRSQGGRYAGSCFHRSDSRAYPSSI